MHRTLPFHLDLGHTMCFFNGFYFIQVKGQFFLSFNAISQIIFPHNWYFHPPVKMKSLMKLTIEVKINRKCLFYAVNQYYLAFLISALESSNTPLTTKQLVSVIKIQITEQHISGHHKKENRRVPRFERKQMIYKPFLIFLSTCPPASSIFFFHSACKVTCIRQNIWNEP